MAYMNQELKAERAPAIKAILKKYNVKGSLAVRSHMTLVLNIKSGAIDFIRNFNKTVSADHYLVSHGFTPAEKSLSVNPYHYDKHFSGKALAFMNEIFAAMNKGNHDNSDVQTDYFDVGFYVDVNIGQWDKPYELTK
jgi:hypothetical protein